MNQEVLFRLVVTRFELLEGDQAEYLLVRSQEGLRENGPKSVVDCMQN